MTAILEKDIQKICVDYLKIKNWMVIDFSKNENHDIAGISDILAIKKNRYVWIEFKRPGNKQQDVQVQFEQKIKAQLGEYILIYSLDDLLTFLGEEIQEVLF